MRQPANLIWEYRPDRPANAAERRRATADGAQRNIAIFDDKVFSATSDAHIVALDARTGKVVWDVKAADSKLGYQYTAGPIVVRGKVIAGITGCSRYKEDVCFITGQDAATGKEMWRTSSIARPGEPGGDTWGELPLRFRAGGDMWIAGSYDPETNLIYWGTAQAKPWARAVARHRRSRPVYELDSRARPGHRKDEVVTTSTFPARRRTWMKCSSACSSTSMAASRFSRWASWGFSGSWTSDRRIHQCP